MTEERIDIEPIEKRLAHKAFKQPSDINLKLWRYMDLAKFIWLLQEKKLVLTRIDCFNDKYEGRLTTKTIQGIKEFLLENKSQTPWSDISEIFRKASRNIFASCWHTNEYESEAMWQLYCSSGMGVAIQTRYQMLVNAIHDQADTYIGKMQYIDYEKDYFDVNIFAPAMHKRINFSHENEVRLIKEIFTQDSLDINANTHITTIPFDTEIIIEKICVCPYAPEYFQQSVHAIVSKFAPSLLEKIIPSQMKSIPSFE